MSINTTGRFRRVSPRLSLVPGLVSMTRGAAGSVTGLVEEQLAFLSTHRTRSVVNLVVRCAMLCYLIRRHSPRVRGVPLCGLAWTWLYHLHVRSCRSCRV